MLAFSQIVNIYENDKWFCSELLLLLEPIEIKIRTQIAYFLGLTYGPDVFYNEKIYKSIQRQGEIMALLFQRNTAKPQGSCY